MGAAGAVEVIKTIANFRHQYVPKLLEHKSYQIILKLLSSLVKGKNVRFLCYFQYIWIWGHNAVLAFKRWEG